MDQVLERSERDTVFQQKLTERCGGKISVTEKAINEHCVPGIGQNYGVGAGFAVFQIFCFHDVYDFVFSVQELILGEPDVIEGSLES